MSDDGRIPLRIALDPAPSDRDGMVLILTRAKVASSGYAFVRHADAAAVAQHGGCPCCRTPSSLVALLRQLFLDRVHGTVAFDGIVVEGNVDLVAQAMSDPLVAARYAPQKWDPSDHR
jgi:hypothetical protein